MNYAFRQQKRKRIVQYNQVTQDATDRLEALELQEHSLCWERHGVVWI